MSRLEIDNLDLETVLKKAEEDVREIKNRQYAGASDLKVYLNDTGIAGPDVTVNAGVDEQIITVTFNSDTMDYAFTELIWRVFTDAGLVNQTHPGQSGYPYSTIYYRRRVTDPVQTIFTFKHQGDNSIPYYYKFFVQSTDTGEVVAV